MDFIWPYFICRDGSAVVLRVDYNIPYLDCAGKRGVQPRGKLSRQVRLPLPPSKPGVYTASSATAAAGITTTALTNTATITTRVKLRDATTQTESVPQSSCPAQATDAQDPAANSDGTDNRQVLLRCRKARLHDPLHSPCTPPNSVGVASDSGAVDTSACPCAGPSGLRTGKSLCAGPSGRRTAGEALPTVSAPASDVASP